MRKYTLNEIIMVMRLKGYKVFERSTKPYNLNIVGVRKDNNVPDKFDDAMYVFWEFRGIWNMYHYTVTTDPGLTYLKSPINVDGTAILKPGQHLGMWEIGLHKGKYEALVQHKPVEVIRDNNKDGLLNFNAPRIELGLFGINIHRALANSEAQAVGGHSAGCQVFQDPMEFDEFMELCQKARGSYGNKFSYTLLEEGDFNG
jgi:hypothetical protein